MKKETVKEVKLHNFLVCPYQSQKNLVRSHDRSAKYHYTTLHSTAIHLTALQFTELHCTLLHNHCDYHMNFHLPKYLVWHLDSAKV